MATVRHSLKVQALFCIVHAMGQGKQIPAIHFHVP